MVCRQCKGIEKFFDQREADSELRRYRKGGPLKTTRMLIDAIKTRGVEGKTLLDIGGGVGVVQHELLKAGVGNCTSVDASMAYLQTARQEAERQGHTDRLLQRHGDFVDIAPEIGSADVVTLDRVICCYHDVERLVGLSSERAREVYGLVYPRDNRAVRFAFRAFNAYLWLRRSSFRVFVHPATLIDSIARRAGFDQSFHHRTLVWNVVVYTR